MVKWLVEVTLSPRRSKRASSRGSLQNIAGERKEKPLSDRNIAELLQSEGVRISCRTVAK
ncbi:hypothetical protein [Thermicanus aegyptius]|uniref:RNA polymerase factor sigma-54 n=1 Tax=Thermicanus aegyptius TaxID=94009 RepID=UPI000A05EB2E